VGKGTFVLQPGWVVFSPPGGKRKKKKKLHPDQCLQSDACVPGPPPGTILLDVQECAQALPALLKNCNMQNFCSSDLQGST